MERIQVVPKKTGKNKKIFPKYPEFVSFFESHGGY